MNSDSRAEVRAEVGYNLDKDFTFLQTNTPDFTDQLLFPMPRGSKEDTQIRTLLENRGVVDFEELSKAVILPSPSHKTFGIVGNEEDDTLTPENYQHLVLFGKDDSGARNLIRFWLLWAAQRNMHIISVSNPGLYGLETYLDPGLVHYLDDADEPLREQVDALGILNDPEVQALLVVGSSFEPNFNDEDTGLIGHIQNRLGSYTSPNIYTLIHLRPLHEQVTSRDFFGSEGEPANVSYALIGDVTERTARIVGPDVPMHNKQGIAWFNKNGTKETKRVRTYLVPRSYIEGLTGSAG